MGAHASRTLSGSGERLGLGPLERIFAGRKQDTQNGLVNSTHNLTMRFMVVGSEVG